jgi:hypothetical protein
MRLHVYFFSDTGKQASLPIADPEIFFIQEAHYFRTRHPLSGSWNMRKDYIIRKRFDFRFDGWVNEKLADRTASFSDRRKGGKEIFCCGNGLV